MTLCGGTAAETKKNGMSAVITFPLGLRGAIEHIINVGFGQGKIFKTD